MAEATALRSNALPYPVYAVPWTVVFPILDADGDLVTGATSPDSEVSKNGDTFADCTNEATEIATDSGMYYLTLTGTEMTADVVAVIVKSATAGAKTTALTLYPRKLVPLRSGAAQGGDTGYITLDATAGANNDTWNGCLCVATIDSNVEARIIDDYTGSNQQAAVTPDWNVAPDSDDTFTIYLPEGMQMPIALWVATPVNANVTNISGSATAADNCELMFNGTGYAGGTTKLGVDVVAVSGDTTAADNLELQYDTNGLVGDTFPARQDQMSKITATGAAINVVAASFTQANGTEAGGTYADTVTAGGVYHQLADAAGTLDCYYEFSISGDGIPTAVTLVGHVTGSNDTVNVYGYNWGGTAWIQIGTITGQNTTTDTTHTFPMYTSMVGTSTNLGKVRVRLYNTGLTTSNTYVDQIFVSYAVVNRSVGYLEGAIWIDTVNGTDGTTTYINGTADKPVKTMADAYTLATALGLKSFRLASGSSIQLTASAANCRFQGAATIDLNGQSIADALFRDAYTISGTSTGDDCEFINCGIGTATIAHGYFIDCRFKGTLTLVASNDYIFIRCSDSTAGAANAATFVYAANCDVLFRDWRGGIELGGMAATNTTIIDGAGRIVLQSDCTGGTVTVRGFFPPITDEVEGGFLGTITDSSRWSEDQSMASITGAVGSVTAGVTITRPSGAIVADVGNTASTFKTNLSSSTTDYCKRAFVQFTSGDLAGQVSKISGFNGSTKFITVYEAFTGAPTASDAFEIINE